MFSKKGKTGRVLPRRIQKNDTGVGTIRKASPERVPKKKRIQNGSYADRAGGSGRFPAKNISMPVELGPIGRKIQDLCYSACRGMQDLGAYTKKHGNFLNAYMNGMLFNPDYKPKARILMAADTVPEGGLPVSEKGTSEKYLEAQKQALVEGKLINWLAARAYPGSLIAMAVNNMFVRIRLNHIGTALRCHAPLQMIAQADADVFAYLDGGASGLRSFSMWSGFCSGVRVIYDHRTSFDTPIKMVHPQPSIQVGSFTNELVWIKGTPETIDNAQKLHVMLSADTVQPLEFMAWKANAPTDDGSPSSELFFVHPDFAKDPAAFLEQRDMPHYVARQLDPDNIPESQRLYIGAVEESNLDSCVKDAMVALLKKVSLGDFGTVSLARYKALTPEPILKARFDADLAAASTFAGIQHGYLSDSNFLFHALDNISVLLGKSKEWELYGTEAPPMDVAEDVSEI